MDRAYHLSDEVGDIFDGIGKFNKKVSMFSRDKEPAELKKALYAFQAYLIKKLEEAGHHFTP